MTTGLTGPGRRQQVRIVYGQPEGGYTSMFEIICCDCGDHPDPDYRDVPPGLQRIRGPYPIAAGVEAYVKHLKRHPRRQAIHQSGHLSKRDPVLVPSRKGRTGDG